MNVCEVDIESLSVCKKNFTDDRFRLCWYQKIYFVHDSYVIYSEITLQ